MFGPAMCAYARCCIYCCSSTDSRFALARLIVILFGSLLGIMFSCFSSPRIRKIDNHLYFQYDCLCAPPGPTEVPSPQRVRMSRYQVPGSHYSYIRTYEARVYLFVRKRLQKTRGKGVEGRGHSLACHMRYLVHMIDIGSNKRETCC